MAAQRTRNRSSLGGPHHNFCQVDRVYLFGYRNHIEKILSILVPYHGPDSVIGNLIGSAPYRFLLWSSHSSNLTGFDHFIMGGNTPVLPNVEAKGVLSLTIRVNWSRATPCSDTDIACKTRVKAAAFNTGRAPVRIAGFGIRYPKSTGIGPRVLIPLSTILAPGEKVCVYLEFEYFRGADRHDIIFVQETAGKKHYPGVNLRNKISRLWWWYFGKLNI